MVQPRVSHKTNRVNFKLRQLTLGFQPPQQRMVHDTGRVADASGFSPNHSAQDALGGEQRHLRIVGDRANSALMRD